MAERYPSLGNPNSTGGIRSDPTNDDLYRRPSNFGASSVTVSESDGKKGSWKFWLISVLLLSIVVLLVCVLFRKASETGQRYILVNGDPYQQRP